MKCKTDSNGRVQKYTLNCHLAAEFDKSQKTCEKLSFFFQNMLL